MRAAAILLVLNLAAVALAKEDPEARRLTDQGLAAFRLGQFPEAVSRFQEAYRIERRSELLFNIAQAYRLGRDCPHALQFYRAYLDARPTAFNRVRVEERIEEMQ